MAICIKCGTKTDKDMIGQLEGLCEDCYLETRMDKKRKTHWQYIRSIKTEYLRPAAKNKKTKEEQGDISRIKAR